MSMKSCVSQIKDLIQIQGSDGTWDYDPYMHGMLNGMVLCLSVLTNEDPIFKQAPKKWTKNQVVGSESTNTEPFVEMSREDMVLNGNQGYDDRFTYGSRDYSKPSD